MRIEKINDKQIRCTLNKKDLKDREIQISELAYGTDKAKALFRDMMQQASYEFGFEAEDIPLMIEAIPMLPDTLVLVITKVEEPDELDTRFSHFSDDSEEDDEFDTDSIDASYSFENDGEDSFDDLYSTVSSGETLSIPSEEQADFISLPEVLGMEPHPKSDKPVDTKDLIKIYSFQTLQQISQLADNLVYIYHGMNTVYKDSVKGSYTLVLHKSEHTPEDFNKICNIVSEYGIPLQNNNINSSFFEEHFEPLIKDNALQVLGSL